jgi:hypothetical protein
MDHHWKKKSRCGDGATQAGSFFTVSGACGGLKALSPRTNKNKI